MRVHLNLLSLLPGLLPLALAACVNAEPAIANPSASPAIGVDLGGRSARPGAVEPVAATSGMTMAQANRPREVQMAHEGHGGAHGTGTVTSVNAAQGKIGLQHGPIPAIGWPAMTMELAVAPSINLRALQPGMPVNFSLEKGRDGIYMIQWIQPAGAAR